MLRTRAFEPADLEACLAIFDSNVPEFFLQVERAEYAAYLRALPGPYLVLEDGRGAVVGCGGHAVRPGSRVADLCWGMVRRDLHGTGLGTTLAHARLEAALSDKSVGEVALNTSQHTRGFYERLGFNTVEVVRDGYGPGLDRCELRLARADYRAGARKT